MGALPDELQRLLEYRWGSYESAIRFLDDGRTVGQRLGDSPAAKQARLKTALLADTAAHELVSPLGDSRLTLPHYPTTLDGARWELQGGSRFYELHRTV